MIAVLDSPEVVRRQVLWFSRMPLPDDTELIIVDDKSKPPLVREDYDLPRFRIFRHEIPCHWSQPAARNLGCQQAEGEWLICTDIDHIVTKELIDFVRDCPHDFVKFKREVAILNEDGDFEQSVDVVKKYGFRQDKLDSGGFHLPPHTNSFAIKKWLYHELGGVSEQHIGSGRHPNREELPLRRRVRAYNRAGKITMLTEETDGADNRPMLYMFPNGRYCGDKDANPFNLFHSLPRKATVPYVDK